MTQTVDHSMDLTPIAAAQAERKQVRSVLLHARESLQELVRQRDGQGGAGIVDEIADRESIAAADVQQALWSLMNEGLLVMDGHGKVSSSTPLS